MFDRLVFVEGPTDEAVLSEFAGSLNIDLSSKNIGFVRMGGASNTSYFASESTMDLLSRRQVPMIFVIDRDEKDTEELGKISNKLGPRAKFHVLERRELENYLLIPEAIQRLIAEKRASTAQRDAELPTPAVITEAANEAALSLKDRVVSLRVARMLLKPVYLERASGADGLAKIESALSELEARREKFKEQADAISNQIYRDYDQVALRVAPGSEILDLTMKKFGLSYQKERDAARLASFIPPERVPEEIRMLLRQIAG
jgi:hypothetical protein